MHRLTVDDLIGEIAKLDKSQVYRYYSGKTLLKITEIRSPHGPIRFMRWESDSAMSAGKPGSISSRMLAKFASVCSNRPNYPIHIDRLFSAGGNSRSALETLLAYTPHFFMCFPERVDSYTGEVLKNLKHIMWCPEEAHPIGQIQAKDYNETIAELELFIDFGQITISRQMLGGEFGSIEAKTLHTQMQIALIEIGNALNFRTWVAKNDRHIPVRDTTLGQLRGVVQSLDEIKLFYKDQFKDAASLIDCIWFTTDGDRIPAIIEIEHSTGVTSGLTRMKKLSDIFPLIAPSTLFVIVAPDKLRSKVISEANQKVFRSLNARYMPYSTVRELYGLVQRYRLTNVVDHTFIVPFMEQVVDNNT